jgi:hypothetical protein
MLFAHSLSEQIGQSFYYAMVFLIVVIMCAKKAFPKHFD